MKLMADKKYTFIDLFAGCGGFACDLGQKMSLRNIELQKEIFRQQHEDVR